MSSFDERQSSSRRHIWRKVAAILIVAGFVDAGISYLVLGVANDPVEGLWPFYAAVPEKVVLALFVPLFAAVARRFPVERWFDPKIWIVHLPVAVLFALVQSVSASFISTMLITGATFPLIWVNYLTHYFIFDILLYFAIVGSYYAFDYYERYHEQRTSALRLEADFAQAHLQALRAQLNPHFLFNALNVISGLALRRQPEKTASLIADLAHLLRRSMELDRNSVSLREEIDFLQKYISIERARVGDRFEFTLDVRPGTEDCSVPSLLLQTLVENSLKHGGFSVRRPGQINVQAKLQGDSLVLTVSDTGRGFPANGSYAAGGIGLRNASSRIAQLFGRTARIEAFNGPEGGATVLVTLPAIPAVAAAV